jgi:Abnormal spindle-like microcephaly-assoc'd, ASPM-SPD-2-Hydin
MKRSGSFVASRVVTSLAATILLLATALAAFAGTPLLSLFFTPDVPTVIAGTAVAPNQVVVDDLAGGVTHLTFPALPAGVHIATYFQTPDNHQLLSFDTPVTLPAAVGNITITPRDVASFDGTAYSLYFAGVDNGVPAGAAIDAITMIDGSDLALSFDIPVALPGPASTTITAYPRDLLRLTGSGAPFQIFFDGGKNGVPAGVNLVGADYLESNTHLLLVFDGSGSVGGVEFTPQDVLEFDPAHGDWSLAYDAEAAYPGFAPAHILGIFALEPTPTPTVTAIATPTATPTAVATLTPTATSTPTITPTATPTVVPVKIRRWPSEIDFPNQPFGTIGARSDERRVTVHNPMNRKKDPIIIGTPHTTSNEFQISSNNCPPSLAPGTSCKIGVKFMPAQLGRRTGTLEIVDNARNNPQHVSLVGRGVRPKIRLRPRTMAFGRWHVGIQSQPETIAITNQSPVPVQIDNIEVTGAASAEFVVVSDCPNPLGALAQCNLSVSFKPAKKGFRWARIKVTDAARGNPQHVSLSGRGR